MDQVSKGRPGLCTEDNSLQQEWMMKSKRERSNTNRNKREQTDGECRKKYVAALQTVF